MSQATLPPPAIPLALNHVGLTVPDIFAAIDWYVKLFGASHIMGPRLLEAEAKSSHETPGIFGSRIIDQGSRKRIEPTDFVPGRPWRLCYCEDPWGTGIEIMSASYAEMFSNWQQPGMTEPPTFVSRDEA